MTVLGLGDTLRGPLRKGQQNSQSRNTRGREGPERWDNREASAQILASHLLPTGPDTSYLTSPCLNFLICIMDDI